MWLALLFSLQAADLADYAGVYRGLTPVEDSALIAGEVELTITHEEIRLRVATGVKIHEEAAPLSSFHPMSSSEVPENVVGFRAEKGHPQFWFYDQPKINRLLPHRSEFGLIIKRGGMADQLGETVLLSPRQLEHVSCGRLLYTLELFNGYPRGGLIPRLDHGGRARR